MNPVLNILDETKPMFDGINPAYLAFVAANYNLSFADQYDPAECMTPATREFCRPILNSYKSMSDFYMQDTYFNYATPKQCYIYKNLTRDGSPSIRPIVLFQNDAMLLNFVKNDHNEFFVVSAREFLAMLCFVFVQLPNVREAHPLVEFLFEECNVQQIPPRFTLSIENLFWPFRRYFAIGNEVTHRFSSHTLIYIAVLIINEIVKRKPLSDCVRASITFMCDNTLVSTAEEVTRTIDFDIVAENLSDANLPVAQCKEYMAAIIQKTTTMLFPTHKCSNDSVVFMQYHFDERNGLLRVFLKNAFHYVVFRNLCTITIAMFAHLRITWTNEYFAMDATTLLTVHLISIGLCSSQRTRWFSGIMPIYPLVARIWTDIVERIPANEPVPVAYETLAWCAALAWLSILFGKQHNFTRHLKTPHDLCAVLREKHTSSQDLHFADLFTSPSFADTLFCKKLAYAHSQVRLPGQRMYGVELAPPLLRFLFSIETRACSQCCSAKANCPEKSQCGMPANAFDFSVFLAPNQEQGSPVNEMPSLRDCIMAIIPNKRNKLMLENNLNFCNVFSHALYPFVARYEILPSTWNLSF